MLLGFRVETRTSLLANEAMANSMKKARNAKKLRLRRKNGGGEKLHRGEQFQIREVARRSGGQHLTDEQEKDEVDRRRQELAGDI